VSCCDYLPVQSESTAVLHLVHAAAAHPQVL